MAFDYSRLKGRIVEKYGNQRNFAEALPISERSLSLKLNGIVCFKQPEIVRTCELLEISACDIPSYFFTEKVQ